MATIKIWNGDAYEAVAAIRGEKGDTGSKMEVWDA